MEKSPRPAQPFQRVSDVQSTAPSSIHLGKKNNKRLNKKLLVVGIIVAVALVSLAGYFAAKQLSAAQPDKNAYQAVFLSNGQVYFGKLDNVNSNYVQMSNIYYLQVNQDLQAESTQPKEDQAPKQEADGGMQLIKLGDELHGPTDKMQIKSSQVLFWEDLKPNSKVAEAIAEYKK